LNASSATGGVTYTWEGPNSYTSNQQNPTITSPALNASGDYIVTATLNGCLTKDTTSVVVNITPVVTSISAATPVCAGKNMQLNVAVNISGVTFSWTGPDTFSSNQQNPVVNNIKTSGSGFYKVTASRITCFTKDSVF